jgi:hypothetical protein
MKGYSGTCVDLSRGSFQVEPRSFYRQYVGGACLGTITCSWPEGGSRSPARCASVRSRRGALIKGNARRGERRRARSPAPSAQRGRRILGTGPPAGFDAIVLTGRSPKPVYRWIDGSTS